MLMGELKAQLSPRVDRAFDSVLGNRARLILHFNIKVVRRYDLGGKLKDLGQLFGGEPVIRIVPRHPGLEKAGLLQPNRAAAINELLHDVPHFGHVEIGGNRISVRKDQPYVLCWVTEEVCLEGAQVHAILGIFSYRNMQHEIIFRRLEAPDYDEVVALWRRCDGIDVSEGDDRETFVSYLSRNPGMSHAATSAGAIVGAALCGHDGRRGLIHHLAVAPEHRGQGVGKQILRMGLDGLRRHGIARAIILVEKDNAPGREFWIARGFEHISEALPFGMDLIRIPSEGP
jgi:N-acetylglutamate synthase